MERRVSADQGRALSGMNFSIERLEIVAATLLDSPVDVASSVARAFIERNPAEALTILATLFSDGDVETAHRIRVDAAVVWNEQVCAHVRGLILNDREHPGLLPCREQRTPSENVLELFERYVAEGERAFRRDPVVLPRPLSFDKFMLMEVDGESYLRIGGRFHRDIVDSTRREFSACGAKKAAFRIMPRGGGMINVDSGQLMVFGESSEFGMADLRRVQTLLARACPEAEVVVRYGSTRPRA